MIIKGLFKRYKRWNPVHPTSGAFWGMGVGVGCGVGWGPGFGPEVVGYVGAGCGVGFSVGITLAGVGIGLPANFLIEVPYNAFMATRNGALEFTRNRGLIAMGNAAGDGLNNIASYISGLQREASGRFSIFKGGDTFNKGVGLCDMKSLTLHSRSILDHMEAFGLSICRRHKGAND